MEKKLPQDWLIDILIRIPPKKAKYIGEMTDKCYSYVLKAISDKYSNTFHWGDINQKPTETEKNLYGIDDDLVEFYWNIFDPKKGSKKFQIVYDSILVSEKAYLHLNNDTKITSAPNKKILLDKSGIKSSLHIEHITPMSYSWKKVINLDSPSTEEIKECYKYATVVLLHKDESDAYLDGGPNALLCHKDIDTLKKLKEGRFSEIINENEIIEAEDILNNKKKLKDNGSGLLRLIHLVNKSVRFIYPDGKVIVDNNEIYQRLIDNKWVVGQYRNKTNPTIL